MQQIPKIIHQIWSDVKQPLPKYFEILGETWKRDYPDWQYIFWDDQRMDNFVKEHYPEYWDIYQDYPYDVQRWDAVRYLILNEMGGMYVDFDYESLEPMTKFLENKECCFGIEPADHDKMFQRELYFSNALMATIPNHPFIKRIIEKVFNPLWRDNIPVYFDKSSIVLHSTGPMAIVTLYDEYPDKENIFLILAKHVSPFTGPEAKLIMKGHESEEFENRLQEAYAIHYFFNGWV